MIDLTLLGTVRVSHVSGDAALAGMQPKRTALLAFLAIARPRGAHRRDALVALLWPELDQDRARSALRQGVHAIRRTLGSDALSSAGTEVLELERSQFRCDLWALEAAAARADHGAVLQGYGGDLLNGFHLQGAPEFERWLDGERARLRSLVRASAWAEAERACAGGHGEDVVNCTGLAMELSELDEGAARRAMTMLSAVGMRTTALALYERFATGLRRDLEVEPCAETRALADQLRRSAPSMWIAPPPAPLRAVAVPDAFSPRFRRRTFVLAAASLVALIGASRLTPSRHAGFDPRTVYVEAFTSAGVTPGLDSLARWVTDGARSALVGVEDVRVGASAPANRAGTIVRGVVEPRGDTIALRGEVVDRATNVVLRVVEVRTVAGEAQPQVAAFADRMRVAVATALYPGWGTALSQPLSYDAYRLFLDGLLSIKRERHDAALASFEQAFARDTSFSSAGLLAAMERYQLGRLAGADSLARQLGARRSGLRPVDARLLEWINHSLRGDRVAARASMEAVTMLAPSAELAWLQLAVDNVETARPREALAALDHIDPESDFGEAWPSYWATRLEALHILGEHRREVDVAREALRRHPDLGVLVGYELRALAAAGRTREVEEGVQRLAAHASGGDTDPLTTLRQVALELHAHGSAAAARATLGAVRSWYEARPMNARSTIEWQSGYGRTLYLTDDRAGARGIYDSLSRAHPRCLDCVGAIGVLAARDRDTATVRTTLAVLAAADGPFLLGRNVLWQSRIAAALGDTGRAAVLLHAAFSAGVEFDVMTHADMELARIRPDSVYRRFARIGP